MARVDGSCGFCWEEQQQNGAVAGGGRSVFEVAETGGCACWPHWPGLSLSRTRGRGGLRAAGSTHVGFGHAGGVLDLSKKHLCLVHAPALLQFLLFGAQAVLGRILGLQQHVLTLGLLTGPESAFRQGFGVEAPGEGGAQLESQGKGSGPGQGTQPGVRSAVKGWSAMGSLRGRAKRRGQGSGGGTSSKGRARGGTRFRSRVR